MTALTARTIDVLLPAGGVVCVMIEGYFDESCDLDTDGLFCISGYFIGSEAAKVMGAAWAEVLREHDLPFFHMVDCAHGAEGTPYEAKSVDERIEIVRSLIALIKAHTLHGFSALVQKGALSVGMDPYTECADVAVYSLQSYLKWNVGNDQALLFFESGHKSRGRAYARIAERAADLALRVSFAPKEQEPLLQAADLLAWQTTKYVKNRLTPRASSSPRR